MTSNYPQRQPPRFVPTLTQAVEHAQPPTPAAAPAQPQLSPPLVQAVAQPPAAVASAASIAQAVPSVPAGLTAEQALQLERQLQAVIARHMQQLEQEIRQTLHNALAQ